MSELEFASMFNEQTRPSICSFFHFLDRAFYANKQFDKHRQLCLCINVPNSFSTFGSFSSNCLTFSFMIDRVSSSSTIRASFSARSFYSIAIVNRGSCSAITHERDTDSTRSSRSFKIAFWVLVTRSSNNRYFCCNSSRFRFLCSENLLGNDQK